MNDSQCRKICREIKLLTNEIKKFREEFII
jgi:hypothetical protein